MQTPSHAKTRTWAEIDLNSLRHNADVVRRYVGPAPGILAVVKANAYGHGDLPCARALAPRVVAFGVANVEEALPLRDAFPDHDTIVLGPALPFERDAIVHAGCIPVVSSAKEAEAYAAIGPVRVHLAIDTGMGRMGVWWESCQDEVEAICQIPGCELAGIASHLPVPDEDEAFTTEQLATFRVASQRIRVPQRHVLNSAGILRYPLEAHDMVRAGLMLYGISPLPELQLELRPVMTWKSRVALVRDVPAGRSISYGRTFVTNRPTRVATVSVGYADGYHRSLSGRNAAMVIDGCRCPILGRITMDMIMIDTSDVPGTVEPGSEVILLGGDGAAAIHASELAARAGTIPWEILTSVGQRVDRIYV